MAEEPTSRITYRREWRWLPWPHFEVIGTFDPGDGGPLTGKEILQMARDLTPPEDRG